MADQCPRRDEVGEAVDTGLDLLPLPLSGIAKALRRIGSVFIGKERRRRKAKARRQKKWEQAAGKNRDASSAATERREHTARVVQDVIDQETRARAASSSGEE